MSFHQVPLGLKDDDPGKDPEYLAAIHDMPCCVCERFGMEQLSPTEAHHTYHDRGKQTKTPDREAIPLCDGHHQAKYDKSKLSIHEAKGTWRKRYGADHDYIEQTQQFIWNEFSL